MAIPFFSAFTIRLYRRKKRNVPQTRNSQRSILIMKIIIMRFYNLAAKHNKKQPLDNLIFQTKDFMIEPLIDNIIRFVTALPPLLQLLLGIFATVGILRLFMFIVDFIEDRREGKSQETVGQLYLVIVQTEEDREREIVCP